MADGMMGGAQVPQAPAAQQVPMMGANAIQPISQPAPMMGPPQTLVQPAPQPIPMMGPFQAGSQQIQNSYGSPWPVNFEPVDHDPFANTGSSGGGLYG